MSRTPTQRPKFEVTLLDEFMARVSTEPPWIIKGFVPGGAITLISGPRKLARKTYSAFTMFAAIAAGKSLAGFDVDVPPSQVLLIEEEGGLAHTQARWKAVIKGLGIDRETRDVVYQNTHFAFRQGCRLNNEAWERELLSYIGKHNIKVVMLDAFVYMIEGDENDTATQLRAVQTIQAIRATGVAVVVLLHLNNAYGLDKNADIDAQIRGAGPIKDCYDSHIAMRRYAEADKFVDWHLRSRDGEPEKFKARWEFESNPTTRMTTMARLQLRKSFEDDGAVNVDLMLAYLDPNMVYTSKQLRETWDLKITKAKEVCKLLVDEGALVKQGSSYKMNQISSEYLEG